ncbi:MAG: YggT family protein [Acidimicrobiales bacterium]
MSTLLLSLLRIASLLFIARAILSWIKIGPESPFRAISDLVYRATEPILAPVRRVIPPLGGIDLSILIVILGINLVLVPIAASL